MANRQTIEKHARATWKQFSDGGSVDGESGKKRRVDVDPRKQADWSDLLLLLASYLLLFVAICFPIPSQRSLLASHSQPARSIRVVVTLLRAFH